MQNHPLVLANPFFRRALLGFVCLGLLLACAPTQQVSPQIVIPQGSRVQTDQQNIFNQLSLPFKADLASLGIRLENYQVYEYLGTDETAFIGAINRFYQTNPGFCPLENAFFADETGLQFMTLASDNDVHVKGFLYDQSEKPALTYAYFEGIASNSLKAIVCQTAQP